MRRFAALPATDGTGSAMIARTSTPRRSGAVTSVLALVVAWVCVCCIPHGAFAADRDTPLALVRRFFAIPAVQLGLHSEGLFAELNPRVRPMLSDRLRAHFRDAQRAAKTWDRRHRHNTGLYTLKPPYADSDGLFVCSDDTGLFRIGRSVQKDAATWWVYLNVRDDATSPGTDNAVVVRREPDRYVIDDIICDVDGPSKDRETLSDSLDVIRKASLSER